MSAATFGLISERMDPRILTATLHQFKLPLNVIIGFADLLKDQKLDLENRDNYVNLIYQEGTSLSQLVDNLIDLFTIASHPAPIEKTACYVNEVFDEVFKEFEMVSSADPQRKAVPGLIRSGYMKSLCIQSDSKKLRQVLSNIVANSFQLTSQQKVEIGYFKQEKYLEFFVKDNVKSLTVEDLDTIFSSFNINSTIRDHALIAAALRLAISQKLVTTLCGKLWTEKKRGEGSALHFTIPYDAEEIPARVSTQIEMEIKPVWDNFHLMITEDIDTNYIYLAELLKPTRIKITWARNGREAVEIASKTKDQDLILMDILMPKMDGFEAAKKRYYISSMIF
jgi:K+-sensing histidine kinase KdpD